MKRTPFYFVITILLLLLIGCSEESPSIRTQNQFSEKANVQFKTVNNTINQNDIAPAITTSYQDITEGKVEVTAVIQNETAAPSTVFTALKDYNYTILIVNSTPPVLKVNTSNK